MKLPNLLMCSLALMAGACGSDGPAAPRLELSRDRLCATRDSLAAQLPSFATIDDQFELMAKLLPGGFAGLTASTVFLKHPDQADTFARAVEIVATCAHPLPYLTYGHVGAIVGVDYDWVELRTWYRILQAAVPMTANSSDIDEAVNRLHFTFTTQALLDQYWARALTTGVPPDMLLLTIGGPAISLQKSAPAI